MAEPWLSADVIANHLGITNDTVYACIADMGMPAHKIGRLWKFQGQAPFSTCAHMHPFEFRVRTPSSGASSPGAVRAARAAPAWWRSLRSACR